ncbi:MAG TPA: CvpA family protein [Pyrinomonadaceae bacterium]|nr:CvpA family protein [Pyrinomonadaceae bacterium]
MDFNYIDALLVLIILLSAFFGWHRGFILGLLDLVRWIGSFLAALYFYQPVSHWVGRLTDWEEVWNQPLAFILIVVTVGLLIQIVGNYLLRRLPPDVHRRRVNRFLGILPGLINGLITAAIVASLLFSMPFSDGLQENLRQSRAANQLAVFTEELETALAPIFEDAIKQTLNRRIPNEPESSEIVSLPFKVENTRSRPELEAEMLMLVNQERSANGLAPLEADPEMAEVARRHSADMFSRGYFAHNTPENKSPFDRMRESEVRFRTAGENLALAPTVPIAHTGLMNSPGHRANILKPQFGRVGIGILDGGKRGLMVTQNFRN